MTETCLGITLDSSPLHSHPPQVAEVGDRAGKEYGLEKTLNKMKAKWR